MKKYLGFIIRFFSDAYLVSLARNSFWIFIADIGGAGIAFIQGIVLARFLGVEGYGLLALITVYVSVVNQVIDFRIRETVVKYVSEFWVKQDIPRLWATIKICYIIDLFSGIIAFLAVLFTVHLATTYIIHQPGNEALIALYAITLLFSTVDGTSSGILAVFEKFKWLSFYSLAASAIRFCLVLIFLFYGYGLKGILYGYIVASFLSSLIILYLAFKALKRTVSFAQINSGIGLLVQRWKELAKFLFNTNLNELLTLFTKNVDILILGYFWNPLAVGYYRLAKNFMDALSMISNPVATAAYPLLAKFYSANKINEFKYFIRRISVVMLGLVTPIALAIFIAAPWVVRYAAGDKFLPSVLLIRIMLSGVVVSIIFLWIRPAFLSMNRPGILTLTNLFCAVTMFILSLIIVPRIGYLGSALVFVYPYLVGHIIALAYFLRIVKYVRV